MAREESAVFLGAKTSQSVMDPSEQHPVFLPAHDKMLEAKWPGFKLHTWFSAALFSNIPTVRILPKTWAFAVCPHINSAENVNSTNIEETIPNTCSYPY